MSDVTLDVAAEIAREIVQPTGQDGPTPELHFGKVTAVDTLNATVSVEIGGDAAVAGLPYLSWYAPTVNDRVFLFRAGAGILMVAGTYRPLAGAALLFGAGTPEGAVTAPVGVLYRRTDGGANTTLYVKQSGSGNTGWGAVPTTNSAPTFTGTVTGANFSTAGTVTATGTVTGGNLATGGAVLASGDVSGDALVASGRVEAETGTSKEASIGGVGPATASGVSLLNSQSRLWSTVAGRIASDILEPEAVWSSGTVEAEAGEAGEVAIGTVGPFTTSGITFRNGASVVYAPSNGKVATEDFECDELTVNGSVGITGGVLAGGAIAADSISVGSINVGSHDFTKNTTGEDPHLNNWTPDAESSSYPPWFGGDYADNDNLNQLRAAYENLRVHVVELTKYANAIVAELQSIGMFQ